MVDANDSQKSGTLVLQHEGQAKRRQKMPHPCKNYESTNEMLMSSFNGRPAPGGIFEESTRIYRKQLPCRAFFWPLKSYPIDAPIVEQLKNLGCEMLVLEVIKNDGCSERYSVKFDVFLEKSTLVDWPQKGDPRFPVRRYLPLEFWEKDEPRFANEKEDQADEMPPDIPF